MSSLKFGTSGLRGLVVDLAGRPTHDHVRAFLAALRSELAPGAPVLIGRDLRSSSPAIAATAAAAVAAAGHRPLDCGALPTPALALEAARLGCPAVMVTGSHIPDDRNGLKFYTARGEITKAEEAAILAALPAATASGPAPSGETGDGAAEPHPEAARRYLARYTEAFGADALSGLAVGVYQHSTVVRDMLAELIAALGGTPVPFGRSDRFVPVDTEAHRAEDLDALRAAAAGAPLDAIVSADGDADRPLLADAAGAVLPGDVVGTIAARHLGADAVAVPVSANSAIEAAGGFARVVRTRIGSPFVVAGMAEALRDGASGASGELPRASRASRPTAASCSARTPRSAAGPSAPCRRATPSCRSWRCWPRRARPGRAWPRSRPRCASRRPRATACRRCRRPARPPSSPAWPTPARGRPSWRRSAASPRSARPTACGSGWRTAR